MPGRPLVPMEKLVEWRALAAGPVARALGEPVEVHALVNDAQTSLCGREPATDLSLPVTSGQSVCPWCVAVASQVALSLVALLPTHITTDPTQENL